MHEQAVGFINGCSRTGEREALGAPMRLVPLNCTHCQGIMAPGPKRLKIIHKFKKTCNIFCPITRKRGRRGIRIQHDWKAEILSNVCT